LRKRPSPPDAPLQEITHDGPSARPPTTRSGGRRNGHPPPFLVFLFLVAIDFCRVFYYTVAVENCARNGALWASDSFAQAESPYASATEAARADFPEAVRDRLVVSDPAPVVLHDGANYAEVTCTYQFQTITGYPLVGGPWTIQRVVRARVVPPS
jgi:hypothetical protein